MKNIHSCDRAASSVDNPRGFSGFVGRARPSRGTTNLNTITYHNGPVMTKPVTAYIVWYGNWPASHPALTIVPEFLSNIGNSAWWNILTTYYDNSAVGGAKVSPTVTFAKSTTVGYTKGTNPSNADIQSVVTTAISSGALPGDVNGVYFVLSSADVNQNSGFCTNYCGWHTNTNMAGVV
ncbi:hypothetical protein OEZ86_006114 [Tetradesmus obliquus]|nr:hypothetical protein OEZ86_006114 [Tetradesmus obliquus]